MLAISEMIALSGIERKESRGAHARSDYAMTDDELAAVDFVVERGPAGMSVKAARREPMPEHLAQAVQRSFALYTPEETE